MIKPRLISLLFLIALSLECCASAPIETKGPLDRPQGENTQMTPIPQTSSASGLQSLIEKAKEDLALRLSITAAEISVTEAQNVTWPDSSMGCPQEGMAYAQVLTPGYLILLEYADYPYEYHAGKGTSVIYCQNPTPPILGTPDNT